MKKFNENHLFILKSLTVFIVFYLFLSFAQSAVKTAEAAIANSARIIPFQGTLTNSTGANVADGNYSLAFKIYTVSTGGTAVWSETQATVAVTSGAFSVNIGSTDANGVNVDLNTPPYYLGITVGTNAEMTPRIQLGMSPFAMNAWSVPSGLIANFNATACPTGWTEFTSARGMYIVGLTSGGTLNTAVGTALTNQENRAVGQHNHGITDPGHTHGATAYSGYYNGAYAAGGCSICGLVNNTGLGTSGSSTTGISIQNSGTVAGTNAPYIQLLKCQKN